MNQAVLIANHDTFPVMINPAKLEEFRRPNRIADIMQAILGKEKPSPSPAPRTAGPDGSEYVNDNEHVVMSDKTHLNWLADIFDFKDVIASPGDLLLDFGSWMWDYAPIVWGTLCIGALARKEN